MKTQWFMWNNVTSFMASQISQDECQLWLCLYHVQWMCITIVQRKNWPQ